MQTAMALLVATTSYRCATHSCRQLRVCRSICTRQSEYTAPSRTATCWMPMTSCGMTLGE